MLLTFENIMKFYNLVRFRMKEELNGKPLRLFEISYKVTRMGYFVLSEIFEFFTKVRQEIFLRTKHRI